VNPGRRDTVTVCAQHGVWPRYSRSPGGVARGGCTTVIVVVVSATGIINSSSGDHGHGILSHNITRRRRVGRDEHAEKETDTGRRSGGAAARHPDMRYDMRVSDDGRPEQRGHRVPDGGHIHADHAGIQVGHIRGPGGVHHHQERVVAEVRLELVQRMVPEQAVRWLRSDLRQHPAERVGAVVAQLFTRRQQDVLRVRPRERQAVYVHQRRVQDANRHVQLY